VHEVVRLGEAEALLRVLAGVPRAVVEPEVAAAGSRDAREPRLVAVPAAADRKDLAQPAEVDAVTAAGEPGGRGAGVGEERADEHQVL
jgi:hypothetical protein